jgi:hypothetical protein
MHCVARPDPPPESYNRPSYRYGASEGRPVARSAANGLPPALGAFGSSLVGSEIF